jgi:dTDP-4-dehydrorhamnose reductase
MATRVLVTGATGHLGAYLVRELAARGCEVGAWAHVRPAIVCGVPARAVELTDGAQVTSAYRAAAPDVVIHAAAISAVGDCYRDPNRAEAVNVGGTAALAELCTAAGARLVFVSTDLVFDGERAPYMEADPPAPLSVYGRTKAAAERAVLAAAGHAVVRVSLLYGPALAGRPSFFDQQADALRAGRPVRLFHDEWRTPLGLASAARALVGVATSDVTGVLHVGGPERISRLEMGQRLTAYLGTGTAGVVSASRLDVPGEPRPRDVSLDSTRWRVSFPDQPWTTFEQTLTEMSVR